jgi:ABC-2 type transport system permease protein
MMKAMLTQLRVQFAQDLRDRGTLLVYYLVPLVFYLVMGSIMKAISLDAQIPPILALTTFALTMSAFLGMPQNLAKAREHGIFEAYRAAGIPAWSLPLATIAISTLHIAIVAVAILASAPLLFKADLPASVPAHLLTVLLVALCSESLGALISCLVKKQATMTLAAQCLFLPSIMFTGIMFPSELLPKPMQWIGGALPAAQGMRLYGGGELAAGPLALLCGTAIAAFAASGALFRRIGARK